MLIRPATNKDALAIATISVKAWRHAYDGIISQESLATLNPENKAKSWCQWYEQGAYQSLVAQQSGAIVGFVDFGKDRESKDVSVGEIMAIYLEPCAIGTGIGSKLFDAAIHALESKGYLRCVIWVLAQNDLGRNFYERKGFSADGSSKTVGSTDLVEFRYVKPLL